MCDFKSIRPLKSIKLSPHKLRALLNDSDLTVRTHACTHEHTHARAILTDITAYTSVHFTYRCASCCWSVRNRSRKSTSPLSRSWRKRLAPGNRTTNPSVPNPDTIPPNPNTINPNTNPNPSPNPSPPNPNTILTLNPNTNPGGMAPSRSETSSPSCRSTSSCILTSSRCVSRQWRRSSDRLSKTSFHCYKKTP